MIGEEHEDGAEYGLLMPFVVCESAGGPYNSRAFVAGATMEQLNGALEAITAQTKNGLVAATVQKYVPPDLLPQLDLVAMRHGFRLTSEPWDEHPDEWALATFTKDVLGEGGSADEQ